MPRDARNSCFLSDSHVSEQLRNAQHAQTSLLRCRNCRGLRKLAKTPPQVRTE
ncbi:hypothetical protein E2C01_063390 [Portunus trituberculatus]|uniref:Uncharacterized protein n=1 Tax=Portunus trituberculatus TaxID=210409 RepID=A0A5B7HI10_PORTR|nr:hypothetical protein [Portunus trituberculatus]